VTQPHVVLPLALLSRLHQVGVDTNSDGDSQAAPSGKEFGGVPVLDVDNVENP
jgi:hypothetical protein